VRAYSGDAYLKGAEHGVEELADEEGCQEIEKHIDPLCIACQSCQNTGISVMALSAHPFCSHLPWSIDQAPVLRQYLPLPAILPLISCFMCISGLHYLDETAWTVCITAASS